MRFNPITTALLLFPLLSNATSFIDLEAKNKVDTASEAGKKYEQHAAQVFLNENTFIKTCFSGQPATPEPIKIYFEVTPQGTLGELKMDPDGDTAQCIKKNLKPINFPKPETTFIAKISLQFRN